MKLLAFSVHDAKAEAFLQPFFDGTKGSAIRSFSDACNDEKTGFNRHAADYTLFLIGEFDQELGKLIPCEPVGLGNALTFIVAPNHGDQIPLLGLEA